MLSMQPLRTTRYNKQVRRALLVVIFFYGVFGQNCYGTPLNNVFDTQPIYSVFGADKFYKKRDKGEMRFIISPLYQQTSTVRDSKGNKVPAGNRLGKWNMFGVFFGQDGAPITKPITKNNYPNYVAARDAVALTTSQPLAPLPANTPPNIPPNDINRYRVGPKAPSSSTHPMEVFEGGLTNEKNFDPDKRPFAFVTVPLDYEKIGVRSQLNFDFCFGLGIALKWGVVDVKQAPSPFIYERQFQLDAGLSAAVDPEKVNATPAPEDALALYCNFMDPNVRKHVANDLSIDLTTYRKTDAEDIHLQLYWHFPIEYKDKSGDRVLTMIPYIAFGAWLPVSDESDPDKPFSVPTGNDGFTAFTADVSLAFDFPVFPQVEQTLQGAFGGGILLCSTKTKDNQRFPTSEYQVGMIPWKVGSLTNRPGLTWYFNASAKSEEFIEGLSIYFDFLYTKHLEDKITLSKDSTPNGNTAFENGRDAFVNKTSWKNQQVNIGMNYKLCRQVSLGGAVQAHISGIRVYRSVTLLGGATITF